MTTKPEDVIDPGEEKKTSPRRVFLVDDHAVLRQGIAYLINLQSDLTVCGQAEEAPAALRAIQKTKPDVVIVDITLGQGNGLELIKDIRAAAPQIPVLVVTMHDERIYGERALRARASGYIMKNEAIEKVIHALRVVLDGKLYLSDAMTEHILSSQMHGKNVLASDPVNSLSDRELGVFQQIGNWKGTREIAADLNLSIKTIEYYRETIKKKLNLKSGTELVQMATDWVEKESGGKKEK